MTRTDPNQPGAGASGHRMDPEQLRQALLFSIDVTAANGATPSGPDHGVQVDNGRFVKESAAAQDPLPPDQRFAKIVAASSGNPVDITAPVNDLGGKSVLAYLSEKHEALVKTITERKDELLQYIKKSTEIQHELTNLEVKASTNRTTHRALSEEIAHLEATIEGHGERHNSNSQNTGRPDTSVASKDERGEGSGILYALKSLIFRHKNTTKKNESNAEAGSQSAAEIQEVAEQSLRRQSELTRMRQTQAALTEQAKNIAIELEQLAQKFSQTNYQIDGVRATLTGAREALKDALRESCKELLCLRPSDMSHPIVQALFMPGVVRNPLVTTPTPTPAVSFERFDLDTLSYEERTGAIFGAFSTISRTIPLDREHLYRQNDGLNYRQLYCIGLANLATKREEPLSEQGYNAFGRSEGIARLLAKDGNWAVAKASLLLSDITTSITRANTVLEREGMRHRVDEVFVRISGHVDRLSEMYPKLVKLYDGRSGLQAALAVALKRDILSKDSETPFTEQEIAAMSTDSATYQQSLQELCSDQHWRSTVSSLIISESFILKLYDDAKRRSTPPADVPTKEKELAAQLVNAWQKAPKNVEWSQTLEDGTTFRILPEIILPEINVRYKLGVEARGKELFRRTGLQAEQIPQFVAFALKKLTQPMSPDSAAELTPPGEGYQSWAEKIVSDWQSKATTEKNDFSNPWVYKLNEKDQITASFDRSLNRWFVTLEASGEIMECSYRPPNEIPASLERRLNSWNKLKDEPTSPSLLGSRPPNSDDMIITRAWEALKWKHIDHKQASKIQVSNDTAGFATMSGTLQSLLFSNNGKSLLVTCTSDGTGQGNNDRNSERRFEFPATTQNMARALAEGRISNGSVTLTFTKPLSVG
jgi:hypothetical protein